MEGSCVAIMLFAPAKAHFLLLKGDRSMDASENSEKRLAMIAIVVENYDSVEKLNKLMHENGEHIIGRMGMPCRDREISLISVALDAPGDVISSLSGKLGMLPGVSAKTVNAKTSSQV